MNNIVSEPLEFMPVERKNGTYALRLCLKQGELTAGMMKNVLDTMSRFGLTSLRATTGQRMNLEGIPKEKLNEVVESLGTAVEKAPPAMSVCSGAGLCKYGMQESRGMSDKLLAVVMQNGPYPFKVKSGVSGCKIACGLSFVRDIGMIGGPKGWDVNFGGAATKNAGLGVSLGKNLSEDEALELAAKALTFYKENGRKRERTSNMVRRLGAEALLEAVK
ncbi:nitrite and sulphite reductase 4Fe-4S region [Maridesulfovibrio hydrothermalis]|uniref:Nitrite and sulphite reductase 4Fe-4S region n=1 Tax=Maridesulfovibrio hydrothermalis AM13 = DSM 14728 TaxID=1121451 RepID=L0RE26_9BACT|nr:nitrite and sulphite reductase 4Fe-4S region [Maridesulfovibrio hydrothermalis]CCO24430.1 Nitrite and sulphite reductase 4Fe-4S region [Maridesulfovibrio hydrothermalis AM13 = DSM 14728]